ncbi:site-specific DNA-methyltransferase, partial [Nannocystis sp.]|uniref:DNA methyltransferase n=1 Tax=Nannocystis sp. TaxID=1962667 RepID=UPI0025DD7BC6
MSADDARPELRWPGKRGGLTPGPGLAPLLEQQVGPPDAASNLLICADNLLAMDALLATHAGAIDLIYIDPPFATGHDFVRTSFTEGEAAGEPRGELQTHAYHDRWPGGVAGFLRMLEPRLRLAHRLLAADGSLYLHVDPTVGHYAKILLDEIFGPACFQREIVWRIGWLSGFKTRANNWIRNHDLIFFYTRDPARFSFHKQYVPHPEGYRRRDGKPPRARGVPMEDVWNANSAEFALRGKDSLDSIQIKSFSREKTGWATQKNASLLRRIIAASSDPGDLVADFFCGSGTTLVAAAELGRRFIGCDCAPAAVELAHARLVQHGLTDMSEGAVRFARCSLGSGERRVWLGEGGAREHVARLLRHHGAEPLPDAAALHGQRGEFGVLVGPHDGPVDRAAVQRGLAEVAARGLRGLEVLAWEFGFAAAEDLSLGTGLSLRCLQIRRELLDDRCRDGAALGERPAFDFTWTPVPDAPHAVQVGLRGASLRHPELLAPGLRAALTDWRALVESWSVEFAAEPDRPLRPDQRWHRTRQQPTLGLDAVPHHYPGAGPFLARVLVVDCFGAAHELRFTVTW